VFHPPPGWCEDRPRQDWQEHDGEDEEGAEGQLCVDTNKSE